VESVLVTLILLVALIALVVALLFWPRRGLLARVVVHDYERGLRYQGGKLSGLLNPGAYTVLRPLAEIRVLDVRPVWLMVEGQEVPTRDGVAVKVSLAARYVIGDAVTTVTADQDYKRALYLVLQLALREAIARRSVEEALEARVAIGQELLERCAPDATSLGLELLSVAIRDVMVPAELKRAYAAVLSARKDGEAALERARGETASLRNLANSARLLDDSPGLLRLRALQEVGKSTGNTIMLGLDGGSPTTAPEVRAGSRTARRTSASSGDAATDER
jgi:regulator of protease activity HflC (stomatin/prohibitin superfamily)